MTRLPLTDPEQAAGPAAELLAEYAGRNGGGPIPPMVRGMAAAPVVLRGYLDLSRAVKRSRLDPAVRERISLAQQDWIGCDYCLAAHTRAAGALGLDAEEIARARAGTAADPRVAALVAFARRTVSAARDVGDEEVERLRELGWSAEEIADVVALAALNTITGAFNLVAGIHPAAPA